MKTPASFLALLVALPGSLFGGGYNSIYATTNLTSPDSTKWSTNGIFGNPGGSLISTVPIPDGTAEYEIRSDFTLASSGGFFGHHLRSTANATTQTGSSFLTEFQNPVFLPNGLCSGTLAGYEINSGAVTQIFQVTVPCAHSMYMRTVVYGGFVMTMINGQIYGGVTSFTTGTAGLSQHDVPAGNSVSKVEIFTRSHDVPAPIQPNTVGTSSFPDKVDLHWTEPADTTGVGITQHYINRFDPSDPGGQLFYGFDGGNATDATVQPSTNYQYRIGGISFHGIFGNALLFAVVTPGAGSVDPRRVGVRPTGTYWGDMGENIDALSGNLNFTIPLLKAQGRKDSSIAVGLSYNSQIWRHDNGGDWMLGQDVGYGLGWRLSPGSLTPFWNGAYYTRLDHYTFTDSSGAEYRLYKDPANPSLYISKESIYVTFDSDSNRLWFNNGTFWVMNCISGGTEADFGTMYPTLVQDSNGNQVVLQYKAGTGTDWTNSSARIDWIQDVRTPSAGHHTFEFSYGIQNTEAIQHLNTIRNYIQTSENYNFYTLANRTLTSPFTNNILPLATTVLQIVAVDGYGAGSGRAYEFLHDYSSQELTKVTLPTGGVLDWNYRSFTFNYNRSLREISNRYLTANADGTTGRLTYPIGRATDAVDGSLTLHSWFTVDDPSGAVHPQKSFSFQTTGPVPLLGAVVNAQSKVSATGAALRTEFIGWSSDSAGNPFLSSKQTLLDGGTSFQQNSLVTQERNQFGASTRSSILDYTNSQTPYRIYETSHVTDAGAPNASEYISRYIRDREVNVVVKNHSTAEPGILLSHSDYDLANSCGTFDQPAVIDIMHDPAYSQGRKGNKTNGATPQGASCWMYDTLGNVFKTAGPGVPLTTVSTNLGSNYTVPGQLQIDGDLRSRSAFQFNAWLGVTNVNAPNGANSTVSYDALGRTATSLSPLGVQTNYYYYPDPNPDYGFFPPSMFSGKKSGQIAITGGRHWTRTTSDGLGRTVRVESGDVTNYSNSLSIVDTQYGPCACSPMGKVTAISQPYSTGQTPVFTTYLYDTMGRVTSQTLPDGSTTVTQYQGNTTRVTDPAGKWKATTSDVQGNIVLVTEPDPSGQASSSLCDSRALPPIAGGSGALQTCYTYDTVEHLTNVVMPRSTATQTRTFNYDPATLTLTSEVHPETGLSCYFYTSDSSNRGHSLLQKVVAKGNVGASCADGSGKTTLYSYDAYSRVTQISRTPEGALEDACQRTNYVYDVTGLSGGNAWGRIGQSSTGAPSCTVIPAQNGMGTQQKQFVEQFSYNSIGQPLQKRLNELSSIDNGSQSLRYWDMSFAYSATAESLLSSIRYPDTNDATGALVHTGYTVFYSYDLMGRQATLSSSTDSTAGNSSLAVTSVGYNAANQMVNLSAFFNSGTVFTQSRTYNSLNQLEGVFQNNSPVFGYEYVGGQNNGQLHILHDYAAGQTITYAYDSLKRIATAGMPGLWNQAYTYDGFGNLTAKTGSMPQSLKVDASTNRLALTQGQTALDGGFCYDKFGNMVTDNGTCPSDVSNIPALYNYDVANRLTGSGPAHGNYVYMYNAQNQRVAVIGTGHAASEQLFFYGFKGEKLATINPSTATASTVVENVYFAGQLWMQGLDPRVGTNVLNVDRIGSVRGSLFNFPGGGSTPSTTYLPFGEELNATGSDREKFGTYTRDSTTGFDYANQRYYASQYGRFLTADPIPHGSFAASQSWNQYSYATLDPVNSSDPSGLCTTAIGGFTQSPASGPFTNTVIGLNADSAYPFAGQNVAEGIASLNEQETTNTALSALRYALSTNDGTIDVIAYSGGASAFTNAYNRLSTAEQAQIGIILYVSPGANGLIASNSTTFVVTGTGVLDVASGLLTQLPLGLTPYKANCDHSDFACLTLDSAAAGVMARLQEKGGCKAPKTFLRNGTGGISGFGVSGGGGGGYSRNFPILPPPPEDIPEAIRRWDWVSSAALSQRTW